MSNDLELIQQDLTQVGNATAYLDEINEALNRVYQVAPSAGSDLALIQANAQVMLQTLNHVVAASQALMRIALDFQKQRDQIAAAHESMKTDLKKVDLSNPFVAQVYGLIYEEAMTDHNEAFWDSLPYDMAEALGDKWHHWNADALYTAITIDPEAVPDDPMDYGFTYAELIEFRENLLNMVNALTKREQS